MANSPFEVVRFGSGENGYQLLIIFRNSIDAQSGLAAHIAAVEGVLAKAGFGNFVTGQITVGSRQVTTLDFNRTNSDGLTWSCRHYIFVEYRAGQSRRTAMQHRLAVLSFLQR
jgi:hypothetical protein